MAALLLEEDFACASADAYLHGDGARLEAMSYGQLWGLASPQEMQGEPLERTKNWVKVALAGEAAIRVLKGYHSEDACRMTEDSQEALKVIRDAGETTDTDKPESVLNGLMNEITEMLRKPRNWRAVSALAAALAWDRCIGWRKAEAILKVARAGPGEDEQA